MVKGSSALLAGNWRLHRDPLRSCGGGVASSLALSGTFSPRHPLSRPFYVAVVSRTAAEAGARLCSVQGCTRESETETRSGVSARPHTGDEDMRH